MKRYFHILMLACLMLAAASVTTAQDDKNYQHGVAYSIYNKAKNETTFEVRQLEILKTSAQWIYVNASTSFAGLKLPKRPDDVIFIVQFASNDRYKYPDQMQMSIKIDGQKMPDVLMLNLDKRMADSMFLETIGTRMKYDLFAKIAKAKTVELQLSTTTFSLNSAHLSKLNDLEKMMNP